MFDILINDFDAAIASITACDSTYLLLFMAFVVVIVPFIVRPFGVIKSKGGK